MLTINDDCIYKILDFITLNDLCSLSQTCQKLYVLCADHFRRKYPNEAKKEVRMKIEDNETTYYAQNYCLKYFNNFIKNVKIYADSKCRFDQNNEWAERVVTFFEAKCDKKLYRICIKGHVELVPWCAQIENFLCNVEVVEFIDESERGQDMVTLLQFCPNVKKLILKKCIHVESVDAVLGQKYEQLTHFSYINGSGMNLNPEQLKIFHETNHQLQCVGLKFADDDNDLNLITSRIVQCIQTMTAHATYLEQLFLKIGGQIAKCFDDVCSQLNVLCERDHFKSLVIRFEYEGGANALKLYSNKMGNWTQLTKIYLMRIRLIDVIPALRSLVHLKIIVLTEDGWFCVPDTNAMPNFDEIIDTVVGTQHFSLPQVEEVLIDHMKNRIAILNLVMLFTRHWVNLKRVLVPNNNTILHFDIGELIRAREKLANACDMTIFTNYDDNTTNLDHKLIKLKYVQFKCNVLDDANLFQRWFMASEQ